MGLFCVSPDHRREKLGTTFYNYIMNTFKNVEWSAVTQEAAMFYRNMKAVEIGPQRGVDGKTYIIFKNH